MSEQNKFREKIRKLISTNEIQSKRRELRLLQAAVTQPLLTKIVVVIV